VLDQVDLSGVPDRLLPDVQALIHHDPYLLHGTLGSIEGTFNREERQPETKPIRQQPYRAGSPARDMIHERVDRMPESKVVRPSTREFASPVAVVPEKDGSPRYFVDYRQVISVTQKHPFSIPWTEDCIDSL